MSIGFRKFDFPDRSAGQEPWRDDLPDGVEDMEDFNRLAADDEWALGLTQSEQAALGQLFLAESEDRPVLGVPTEDYVEVTGEVPFSPTDPYRILQNMDPADYGRLQDTLITIGALDPESRFVRGKMTMNDPTIGALTQVAEFANNSGMDLNSALKELVDQAARAGTNPLDGEAQGTGPGGPQERGRFFVLPDYATLRARVKAQFRDSLGRDPTQAEMHLFTDELMADYRSNAEVEQQAFEDVGAGRDVFVNEVDPVSRFEEAFQQRLGGQMKSIERQNNALQGAAIGQQAVDAVERETRD